MTFFFEKKFKIPKVLLLLVLFKGQISNTEFKQIAKYIYKDVLIFPFHALLIAKLG
jgi:hypothetical protein